MLLPLIVFFLVRLVARRGFGGRGPLVALVLKASRVDFRQELVEVNLVCGLLRATGRVGDSSERIETHCPATSCITRRISSGLGESPGVGPEPGSGGPVGGPILGIAGFCAPPPAGPPGFDMPGGAPGPP